VGSSAYEIVDTHDPLAIARRIRAFDFIGLFQLSDYPKESARFCRSKFMDIDDESLVLGNLVV
jgi:hypothetical protein